ncbi:MAG: COX15/CtaA family protein [Streptosporangiaceae bacterium]
MGSVQPRSVRRSVRAFVDAVWRPSPRSLCRLAFASVVVNVAIVLSGGAVRLSESGLGCPTWPRCTGDSLVPVDTPGTPFTHMLIEFGNRLVTFLVLAVAVLCFVAALRLVPRRRDIVVLATAQPLAIIAQAGFGGVLVLTELSPTWLSAHFMVSMGVLAATIALYARAKEGDGPPKPLVRIELRLLGRALLAVVFVLLAVGTVVTGTGPHGGDAGSPRYAFSIERVAQLHADLAWVTLGLTFALVLALRLTNAPRRATALAGQLLAVELAQGAIGYAQFFLGVPPVLVGLHMLGASVLWVWAWRVAFALRERTSEAVTPGPERVPAASPAPVSAEGARH